jgi:hypothetical protein
VVLQVVKLGPRPGLVESNLWWTKWCWGRFSSRTSVSPVNLHSTILTITRDEYNRLEVADVPSGHSMDSTTLPHYANLKKVGVNLGL